MKKVVGVRFRTAGKAYYFDPGDYELKRGTAVIVDTAQGMEYGIVALPPYDIEDEKVKQPLKPIMRVATEKDAEQNKENLELEKSALRICKEKVANHGLEMKLIDAEYSFDRNKLTFYFTADGRVDFRELVKDLAGAFHTRIELRQIGVRDATRILGGMGTCGRELCCHAYMTDFIPVSIKMAKEQNLSLNPGKISGMCGKLMCCLSYEVEAYSYLNKRMPKTGEKVTLPDGTQGIAQNVDILRGRVKVMTEVNGEKQLEEYSADELEFKRRVKDESKEAEVTENDIPEILDGEEAAELAELMDDESSAIRATEDRMSEQEGRDRGNDSGKGNWKKNKKFKNNKKDHFKNKKETKDGEQGNDPNNNENRQDGNHQGKNRDNRQKKNFNKKQGKHFNKDHNRNFNRGNNRDPKDNGGVNGGTEGNGGGNTD